MSQILTSFSDSEFKELLSNEVRSAVREALSGEGKEKQTQQDDLGIGYRTRSETRKLLGIAYSTMHYWEKAGILVPHRIGRKVFYSDQAIREALSRAGKEVDHGIAK
ncbi:MerR family transcriptional regulator [Sphingobacterium kyonggiense]|nr:MerR family transcriptional regulator [Sphingobacterium mizutaii]